MHDANLAMKVSLQLHFAALRDKDFTSLIYNLCLWKSLSFLVI